MVPDDPFREPEPDPAHPPVPAPNPEAAEAAATAPTTAAGTAAGARASPTGQPGPVPSAATPASSRRVPAPLSMRSPSGILQPSPGPTPSTPSSASTPATGTTAPSPLPPGVQDDGAVTMTTSSRRNYAPTQTQTQAQSQAPAARRVTHSPPPDRSTAEPASASPARKPSRHAHFNLASLPSINPVVPSAGGSVSAPATAYPGGSGGGSGSGSGTANASGAATPHRVQWQPDRVIDMPPLDGEEAGDLAVGQRQDRGQGQRPRRSGWYEHSEPNGHDRDPHDHDGHHAAAPDAPDLSLVNSALETYSRSHRMRSRSSTMSSNTEEDYDYRLDKDPLPDDDHDDHDHGHDHDEQAAHEEAHGRETEDRRLHDLLDSAAASHVHGGYVQLGETDGLPSRPDDEKRPELRAAANLVRSHTGGHKWSMLRRRVKSGSVRRHGGHGADGATRPSAGAAPGDPGTTGASTALDLEKQPIIDEHDEEDMVNALPSGPINQPLNAPPGVTGNSVLSSLLALYHHQHQPESASASAPESTATTPQSSRPPSPSPAHDEPPSLYKRRLWHRRAASGTAAPPNSGAASGGRDSMTLNLGEKHRKNSETCIADRDQSPRGNRFLDNLSRYVEEFRDDRPKAARSGAGVFGALIQSTSGMAAAAVPPASTLMPSAKRPGYHLTRYSLAEEPPSPRFKPPSRPSSYSGFASLRGTGGGGTPPAVMTRPNSTTGLVSLKGDEEKPSRPASVYSAYTDGAADSHKEQPRKSSDDLVMMKPKAAKKSSIPNPLNLKAVKSAENWLTGRSFEDLQRLKEEEKRKKDLAAERRRKKKAREARKKQEIYIIRHVAAIIARQQFLLKLARALMMFGSPTHRIETQIQATAKVLDISAQVVYLPSIMLISFSDEAMHTSETKFLKQTSTLDLGKLLATHNLYWEVVHDRMSVDDANKELDHLMTVRPYYSWWQMVVIGAFCSGFIVIPSYYGSFLDALMCAPLGMLLIFVQTLAAKNDLFSGVFEITIATFISFLAAALGDTRYFCYTALVSGGIVLILPGYIVLTGALEIASRNITAGAVRMGYSVIYSLFLGFGISMGAEIYMKIRNQSEVTNATDYTCSATHYKGAPWYMQTPSGYWYYLCVPAFSFVLSLSNQQPIFRREMPIMMAIACTGWVTNHFAANAFSGRSDIVSAIGSFSVGLLGNIYGRFFSNGASFPVMVTGILMQLPSGLKEGGLFNFAADTKQGTFTQYSSGFSVAAQLISVAIGLTVGLFCAAVITNPFGGSRRRGNAIFSF